MTIILKAFRIDKTTNLQDPPRDRPFVISLNSLSPKREDALDGSYTLISPRQIEGFLLKNMSAATNQNTHPASEDPQNWALKLVDTLMDYLDANHIRYVRPSESCTEYKQPSDREDERSFLVSCIRKEDGNFGVSFIAFPGSRPKQKEALYKRVAFTFVRALKDLVPSYSTETALVHKHLIPTHRLIRDYAAFKKGGGLSPEMAGMHLRKDAAEMLASIGKNHQFPGQVGSYARALDQLAERGIAPSDPTVRLLAAFIHAAQASGMDTEQILAQARDAAALLAGKTKFDL
jgi:hypothetical protein